MVKTAPAKKPAATPLKCTECGAALKLPKDLELNEIISCRDCGAEYEVLKKAPLKLGPAPKEEEDWGE